MNIRIKFSKTGPLRFISHLDVMRYFQKVIRRADMDICFSEGFSPHMLMSFAAPLGVGLTSEGEYVDIRMNHAPSSREALERMNAVMAEGMEAISFRRLPDNSKNAMSIVAAADYEVRFRQGREPGKDWEKRLLDFLDPPAIRVLKDTKKGQQEVDIRPWIYDCTIQDGVIRMQVSAGSVHNLRPELFIQVFALHERQGYLVTSSELHIHRLEIYADQGTEGKRRLIPLEALGEDIG